MNKVKLNYSEKKGIDDMIYSINFDFNEYHYSNHFVDKKMYENLKGILKEIEFNINRELEKIENENSDK